MAKVIGGFASGHTPLMTVPGHLWAEHAARVDTRSSELILPPHGQRVTYDQLLAATNPEIRGLINEDTFVRRSENIHSGLDDLQRRFTQARPDIVVMFGDDQDELFYDNNYPLINVYWGDTMKMIPRPITPGMDKSSLIAAQSYGVVERDYPVDASLGLHIIESLLDQEFDVAQSRYLRSEYGGTIGPATWYLDRERVRPLRPVGMPHAFSFPITRWFNQASPPIVPITMNTCYPPNWISPKRAYALGQAVRKAVDDWASDKTVAFACSGGLSHFVVDEELDRTVLQACANADGDTLAALPRARLQSATTEILNWVATAGAMGNAKMDVLVYEPCYRTPAGTGCGCAVGAWQ